MTSTLDLTPFRTATTLRWHQWTVFAPHRGDDGTLIADGERHLLPLDTWITGSFGAKRAPMTDEVGIVVVDPESIADVQAAVRAWCMEHIGRSDITFEG